MGLCVLAGRAFYYHISSIHDVLERLVAPWHLISMRLQAEKEIYFRNKLPDLKQLGGQHQRESPASTNRSRPVFLRCCGLTGGVMAQQCGRPIYIHHEAILNRM